MKPKMEDESKDGGESDSTFIRRIRFSSERLKEMRSQSLNDDSRISCLEFISYYFFIQHMFCVSVVG